MAEVEDQVLANLRAAAALVDTLQRNPDTRPGLLGLIKKAKPDVYVPEIDAPKPYVEQINALSKKVDDLTTSLIQKDQNGQLTQARNSLRDKFGYTDEGLKELEKFMLETNTADHMVAHDAMQARRPKPAPQRPQFSTRAAFDEGDKDDAEWLSNPERKLDVELNKAFEAIANGMV